MSDDKQHDHDAEDEPVNPPDESEEQGEQAQPEPAGESAQKGRSDKSPPPRRSGLRLVRWLGLLLAALLAAGVGYLIWQQEQLQREYQQVQAQREQLDELEQRLQAQAGRLDELPGELRGELESILDERTGQLEQALGDEQREREELESRLTAALSDLQAQSGMDRERWMLAEAEYLLRLANQRLVVESDAQSALALAESADQLLRELANPALHPVRRALRRELSALESAEVPEREELYLQLEGLSESLAGLPRTRPSERMAPPEAEPAEQEPDGLWARIQGSFANALGSLEQYVRIRRHGEALEAVLLPDDHQRLVDNLQLMIAQAQVAMLREEPDLYRASLDKAHQWLQRYYPEQERAVELRERIEQLRGETVRTSLPPLEDSLGLLQNHRRQSEREAGS